MTAKSSLDDHLSQQDARGWLNRAIDRQDRPRLAEWAERHGLAALDAIERGDSDAVENARDAGHDEGYAEAMSDMCDEVGEALLDSLDADEGAAAMAARIRKVLGIKITTQGPTA